MPHKQKMAAHLFAVVDPHAECGRRGDATNRELTVVGHVAAGGGRR
ncbi:hypothetical protein BLA15945_04056 [Burkholderia lata]|uniref:Uncharacterized protein n=1 Tax=Burkholderia lata (strain ATCC 17760 / DSM 23089 / LMG 22485 / NCIMB 9086 / R18194 / 383) TaxID=482957 RepID=A0A6P2MGT6_BURL3|nr:hypothetical protein BLA15945_04056 [Burkholderia lata]